MRKGVVRILDGILLTTAVAAGLYSVGVLRNQSEPVIPEAGDLIEQGTRLAIRGINWGGTERHVVLFLSTACPACNASVEYYRKMAARVADAGNIRLVAVSGEPTDAVRSWLSASDLTVSEVSFVESPLAIGFSVTPTLLIVNRSGVVTDLLLAKLTAEEETDFLMRIEGRGEEALSNVDIPREFTGRDIENFVSRRSAVVLDIRGRRAYRRGHFENAVNIPRDELLVRAKVELPDDRPIVIDCSHGFVTFCRSGYNLLRGEGFSDVVLLRR